MPDLVPVKVLFWPLGIDEGAEIVPPFEHVAESNVIVEPKLFVIRNSAVTAADAACAPLATAIPAIIIADIFRKIAFFTDMDEVLASEDEVSVRTYCGFRKFCLLQREKGAQIERILIDLTTGCRHPEKSVYTQSCQS